MGNFQEVEKTLTEKYDYITLIGVFEYGEAYIQSETPYVDFLKIISRHLKPDGSTGQDVRKIILELSLKVWKVIRQRVALRHFPEKKCQQS